LLKECSKLIYTLCFNDEYKSHFQNRNITERLFLLLSSPSNSLKSQIIELLSKLLTNESQSKEFVKLGISPLVNILLSDDEYLLIQTLMFLNSQTHYDDVCELLQNSLKKEMLLNLKHRSPTIQQLSLQLQTNLGL